MKILAGADFSTTESTNKFISDFFKYDVAGYRRLDLKLEGAFRDLHKERLLNQETFDLIIEHDQPDKVCSIVCLLASLQKLTHRKIEILRELRLSSADTGIKFIEKVEVQKELIEKARIFKQGQRQKTNIFSLLPNDILVEIIAKTCNSPLLTFDQKKKIIYRNLNLPTARSAKNEAEKLLAAVRNKHNVIIVRRTSRILEKLDVEIARLTATVLPAAKSYRESLQALRSEVSLEVFQYTYTKSIDPTKENIKQRQQAFLNALPYCFTKSGELLSFTQEQKKIFIMCLLQAAGINMKAADFNEDFLYPQTTLLKYILLKSIQFEPEYKRLFSFFSEEKINNSDKPHIANLEKIIKQLPDSIKLEEINNGTALQKIDRFWIEAWHTFNGLFPQTQKSMLNESLIRIFNIMNDTIPIAQNGK